jgi:anti-sigma regulatory factor (Ser/Thr protein kinase)
MNQETAQPRVHVRQFAVQLSSTLRGARLARLLTVEQLREWGLPLEGPAHVVAELTANAVTHGRVPGRDFRLALSVDGTGTLRIEVADARGDRLPATANKGADEESGRGLLLVSVLAERWGVTPGPYPCKTVWAECSTVL